jgi:lactate dehydrogenase-like 2-hydroxyacid dehydrogenase
MWPLSTKKKEADEKTSSSMMKRTVRRVVVGLIIGGAIGSIVGKIAEHDNATKDEPTDEPQG